MENTVVEVVFEMKIRKDIDEFEEEIVRQYIYEEYKIMKDKVTERVEEFLCQ